MNGLDDAEALGHQHREINGLVTFVLVHRHLRGLTGAKQEMLAPMISSAWR